MTENEESADMSANGTQPPADAGATGRAANLRPAARRALAEAEERRRLHAEREPKPPREINGREGLEPVRYGDWEVKGIASDF